jgi:predicted AAA+ superfamily ATPase
MEQLLEISNRLISSCNLNIKRKPYYTINWLHKLIEIKGARGVGKTTLMLQKANELKTNGENVLYVSLDHFYFYRNELLQLADKFYKYGGKYLFIDEVHKYPKKEKRLDWSVEIKNMYDSYPELQLVYSGSSILQLYKGSGDLSRRKAAYHIKGLSLREYLFFEKNIEIDRITLDQLFNNHTNIANNIIKECRILPIFETYLKSGYYPFYMEGLDVYSDRINEIINVILETDIPSVSDITFETSLRLKILLSLLAQSVPFTPNLKKLTEQLYLSDYRTVLKYLNYLNKAELINILRTDRKGNQRMNKPDKIYLNNTNLSFAVAPEKTDIGTIRETFLYSQLAPEYTVNYPKQGDFKVNDYIIEVGGPNKKKNQISNEKNAFIAKDGIETGYGNVIPLWLFGFLY